MNRNKTFDENGLIFIFFKQLLTESLTTSSSKRIKIMRIILINKLKKKRNEENLPRQTNIIQNAAFARAVERSVMVDH